MDWAYEITVEFIEHTAIKRVFYNSCNELEALSKAFKEMESSGVTSDMIEGILIRPYRKIDDDIC